MRIDCGDAFTRRDSLMDDEKPTEVPSPCIQICTLDVSDNVCTGCGRTRAEIWAWTRCSDARKREIVKLAELRKRDLET